MMNIDFNNGLSFKDAPDSLLTDFNINEPNSLLCRGDAKIKNTNQVMYLLLNINDHEVLLIYKYVKIIKNQFIRLLHFPITKPHNVGLEVQLLKLLSKHPQIQEILTTKTDLEYHNFPIRDNYDLWATDFYDILDESHAKVNRGKHKSKVKYTKYKDRIQFRKATEDDYLDIMNILHEWKQFKIDDDTLFNKKTFHTVEKKFSELLYPPFATYITLFDGVIVAFEVVHDEGDTLFQLVNQAYRKPDQLPFDEIIAKDIIAYVHKWNHLLTINELHDKYKIINYEYASDPNGGLFNFKRNLYTYEVPLYRLKFKK